MSWCLVGSEMCIRDRFFGGTSLLIMVGVVLDTLQQIESYLLNRHMDGLMEGARIRGRNELSSSGF
jgi:preprotein translocase subunit SecY